MATDPCSYLNPLASKASCIIAGGKQTTDPCNVLNPFTTKAGCMSSQVTKATINSGLPSWIKWILGIIVVIFIIGGAIAYVAINSYVSGGRRRGGRR